MAIASTFCSRDQGREIESVNMMAEELERVVSDIAFAQCESHPALFNCF